MRERTWTEGTWAWVLCAGLVGCGPGDGRPGESADEGVGISGLDGGTVTEGGEEADQGVDDGPRLDLPPNNDVPPEEEECAGVSEAAELVPLPADIIFVVDNSGSMDFEAQQIQLRMNDFSSQIIASGIDVHVVLISSYPGNGNGICIEPPLGGGGCPQADNNPPTFTHVSTQVSSHDAWEQVLDNHQEWSAAIREDAVKHLVVITDDTSDMGYEEFDAQFQLLSPSYAGYVHHSVVCHSDCPDAAGIGEDYITLSQNTGGVAADLCDQDFQAVFDVLATEVVGGAALSCEFTIPPPPDGMEFDPDEVNLEFNDGMGGILPIGRVDSAADCPNVVDGWHYDDPTNPTMIVMCPQTCERIQASENGTIDIAFGCATVPAG
jgi:hypothetical protein